MAVSHEGVGMSVQRYWMSWLQPTEDYRPLTYPPHKGILGWWCSGYSDDGATLCAVVEAVDFTGVEAAIFKDWPEAFVGPDGWRFSEEIEGMDWRPSDRFPLEPWMVERF